MENEARFFINVYPDRLGFPHPSLKKAINSYTGIALTVNEITIHDDGSLSTKIVYWYESIENEKGER